MRLTLDVEEYRKLTDNTIDQATIRLLRQEIAQLKSRPDLTITQDPRQAAELRAAMGARDHLKAELDLALDTIDRQKETIDKLRERISQLARRRDTKKGRANAADKARS